jgi:hypothetical protein
MIQGKYLLVLANMVVVDELESVFGIARTNLVLRLAVNLDQTDLPLVVVGGPAVFLAAFHCYSSF